jgi:ribosomal protein S21
MQEQNKKRYKKVRREDMEVPGAPLAVKVVNNQIEPALRLWKRKVKDSGHLDELKERQQYTKPKTVRRKQKMDAIRNNQRNVLFEKWENGDNTITMFIKKKSKNNKSGNSDKKQEDLLAKYGLDKK